RACSGIFFSTWHWRRRHSDYSDSATLCFNVIDDLPAEHNSSVVEPCSTGTELSMACSSARSSRAGDQGELLRGRRMDRGAAASGRSDASRVASATFGLVCGLASGFVASIRLWQACVVKSRGVRSYRVNRRAYTSGIFFSSWHWRRRHSDYSDSATLCFNVIDDLPAEHNSSVVEPWLYRNRTVYGCSCARSSRAGRTRCTAAGRRMDRGAAASGRSELLANHEIKLI
uniref:C-type lectin domain-containing protein n=1 Tax=Macrostomum lignano TaxID=282301 RepID=A0A1I8FEP8_9PLAT